jgi:hypothetical protein
VSVTVGNFDEQFCVFCSPMIGNYLKVKKSGITKKNLRKQRKQRKQALKLRQ